ncbi:MAG: AAA family ATPase [Betaproteobacteria bacterium]|nr:AAA family ATPase [Betaproteobacteria bacterium]
MNSSRHEIEQALGFVPAGDRDTWVRMGMAVKAELGDDGFEIWDNWSRADDSYRERDATSVWRSIHGSGGVKIGTLYAEAKAHGYQRNGHTRPPPAPPKAAPRDDSRAAAATAAATAAAEIWEQAAPAPDDFAYLVTKGVQAHGTRTVRGKLLIPAFAADGRITTLQTVTGKGEKRFLQGGAVGGSYFTIGAVTPRILVAEGFATAASLHQATGDYTVVAFNCTNLLAVAKAVRAQHPAATIVVCADDDAQTAGNPGRTKATKAATAVAGSVALPDFGTERPVGATDFNDLMRHAGAAAVRACVDAASAPPAAPAAPAEAATDRLSAVLASAFTFGDATVTTALPYVVKGVFGRGQLVVFWGRPGSGKTFCTAELAGCIGTGIDWHGHRTRRGAVLYVAAESSRVYIENRVAALKQHRPELADAAVVVLPIGLDLLHAEAGDVDVVIGALARLEAEHGEFAVVVIDTLAVTFGGGNENAPEDMGAYVGNVQRIVRDTGVAVLLVHHCGKDEARGMRGHSALIGALDAELTIEGDDESKVRVLRTGKVREGDAFADLFAFELERVELGTDPDGDPVTSCVVVWREAPAGRAPTSKGPKSASLALRCLEEALSEHGTKLPQTSAIPPGTKAVRMAAWRDRYKQRDAIDSADPDVKRATDARDSVSSAPGGAAQQRQGGRARRVCMDH